LNTTASPAVLPADQSPDRPYPGAGPSNPSAQKNEERVWKMFTPPEAINVIKARSELVTIGSGPEAREVTIRPLSPRQLLNAYQLISQLLVPLVENLRPGQDVSLGAILGALGPNIDKVPELIHVILSRGNDISLDWINDKLDVLLDLQLILPIFLRQNGLEKLFSPKEPSPVGRTSQEGPTRDSNTAEQTAV